MKTENNEPAGKLSSGEDTNETAKTEYTEEETRAIYLEMEIWLERGGYDYRYFGLPDRARAHLLKYGSVGREMMLRGELEDEPSIQVHFGYRRALVAEFWPPGQDNDEDPAGPGNSSNIGGNRRRAGRRLAWTLTSTSKLLKTPMAKSI